MLKGKSPFVLAESGIKYQNNEPNLLSSYFAARSKSSMATRSRASKNS